MVTLLISEPGSYPVKVDLAGRWGKNNTVVLGVARGKVPENHVSFRQANGFLSRRQVTIMAPDGDASRLLIRDGSVEPNGQWSAKWKHTFKNELPLSHTDWSSFTMGDRIRFHTEKPALAMYSVQLAYDTTDDGTLSGANTISFDVVRVWQSISQQNKEAGVLLLSVPYNDGLAVVQRLDETAEQIIGGDPGELKDQQEYLILNNLVPFGNERRKLTEHINEAMTGQAPIHGNYKFGSNNVNLRLETRPINGAPTLLGWVTLNVQESQKPTDWKTDAIQWANQHPVLAALVAVFAAIAFSIIKVLAH